MPRPPLPIGTHGKITTYQVGANSWRARTKFRDSDGVTRHVERAGKSKARAERALKSALAERGKAHTGNALNPSTRFREVALRWLATIEAGVNAGTRSPTTLDQYRSNLHRHVLPALGELRIGHELTVPSVEAFLQAVRTKKSVATAKTARSIVSGVLGYAVRHGVEGLDHNPARQTSRLEGVGKRRPRALTADERSRWIAQLEADEKASRWDLPDLSRFMLATGVRIGEALAVYWSEVDFSSGVVAVDHTVVRVRGEGLIRKSTKTKHGERTLVLPSWAVDMLRRRFANAENPDSPVFASSTGGLRDPSNTRRVLRDTRGSEGFAWVTSHVFRKTAATILDEAGLTARLIADQLGHSQPSMTQNVYMGRGTIDRAVAEALEGVFRDEGSAEV